MTVINKLILVVSTDFSPTPGPRKKIEGKFSGEVFRESCLEPKLKEAIEKEVKLFIDLDGTAGFGTSFLEEAFGGLIRVNKYSYEKIINHIELKSEEENYLIDDIMWYLKDANSD
ncbi:MAG TPA: STAS-like domain-containing protein [Nitrosomonas sp.]|nr:STAS-like domain-containing protein [Nitrosomonas sp.]